MSREDRKIEQTIRIIEKAEERRLKREEKKRLAVSKHSLTLSWPSFDWPLMIHCIDWDSSFIATSDKM